MPPNRPKGPPAVVFVPVAGSEVEIVHVRTVGRKMEQYAVVWPSGKVPYTVFGDSELDEIGRKTKAKKVKKLQKPGAERYERNPHEPIKC